MTDAISEDAEIEFTNKLNGAIYEWIEGYNNDNGAARSDWIIYGLVMLAGHMLRHAPDDIRALVTMRALRCFTEACGMELREEYVGSLH